MKKKPTLKLNKESIKKLSRSNLQGRAPCRDLVSCHSGFTLSVIA